jgi:single-strand DNA-binding protein
MDAKRQDALPQERKRAIGEKEMASVNTAMVVGNLGGDPQTRALPSGDSVANFSIATTERLADRSGNRQERTEWHRIVVFGKLADTCAQYLSKGRQVYVEGRLTTREYEAKDGTGKRYRTEIVARQIRFLGRRGDEVGNTDSGEVPF